jgi:hypothetical protein
MATVKIKFAKHVTTLVQYVMDGREPDDPVDAHDCEARHAAQDFQAIAQFHKGHGDVNAIHVIQSWNKEESQKMPAAAFNAIGRQLAEEHFPGHAFLVVTHTNTGNTHNHIVVNPWATATGKKVENKKHHLYRLREKSDTICKARGLSVVNGATKERQARVPEKAQKAERFNGKSWLLDMYQKADFARAYATSHDEYVALLKELGVAARVEDRNISYLYDGQKRAKRGSKMGPRYDKDGLEKAYKANAEKFARVPGLRANIRGVLSQVVDGSNAPSEAKTTLAQIADTTYTPAHRDYAAYQKKARPGRVQRYAHETDLSQSVIPIEDMRRARNASIFRYCRDNNIALEKHDDGRTTLKGRNFVEIGEFDWVNTRNRTRGSLIELAAAHKGITFLQAVADINGSNRLLVLEQHFGEVQRKFTSFYVPKEHRLNEHGAKQKIASVLAHHGADKDHASTLLRREQAQVDVLGVVRLFGKDDQSGAWEFVDHGDEKWSRKKVGSFKEAFFALTTGKRKATVYVDPFSFLQHAGRRALRAAEHDEGVICLMEPDESVLLQHVAKSRHLRELEVFTGSPGAANNVEIDFFNNLKAKMAGQGIEISETKGRARSQSRSHDLPSL